MPADHPSDADLIRRFQRQGDRDALGVLVQRHAGFAYRTAHLLLGEPGRAQDAVQEACIRLMRSAGSYDGRKPFLPWFKTLVARSAMDLARADHRRLNRESSPHALSANSPEDPSMRSIHQETRDRLNAEVDALPQELRLPVVLHYQAGYSHEEIAESLGCPAGTVSTRLATARERLKSRLAPAGLLLAAGVSLEEALGSAAPVPPPPETLGHSLEALVRQGPVPAAVAAPVPAVGILSRPSLLAAAGLLLVLTAGAALKWNGGFSDAASESAKASQAPVSPSTDSKPPVRPDLEEALVRPAVTPAPTSGGVLAATLRGRVTCQETGLAVPGATVTWYETGSVPTMPKGLSEEEKNQFLLKVALAHQGRPHEPAPPGVSTAESHGPVPVRTVADAEGRYEIRPNPGPGYLIVESPAFRSYASGAPDALPVGPDPSASSKPLAGGEVRDCDIVLSRGWGVRARLRRPEGGLCATARVELKGLRTLVWNFPAHADSAGPNDRCMRVLPDGEIEIGGLDPERFTSKGGTLALQVEGFLPVTHSLEDLPFSEGRFQLDLVLSAGRTLRGRVTDPNLCLGGPLGGVSVACLSSEGKLLQHGTTAPDGSFELKGIPADEEVLLWADASQASAACAEMIPVEAGKNAPITLTLDAAGEVSGRLLDAQGNPVADAPVIATFERGGGAPEALSTRKVPDWPPSAGPCAFERRAQTAVDGRYTLKGIPAWKGLLIRQHAEHRGAFQGWTGVPVGTRNLDIRMVEVVPLGRIGPDGQYEGLKPYEP